ncbi:MAG TPA: hypothetical protein VJ276_25555 [Thermoanaerobaculia bacterium]|nr:hypothetical protein [Thermoanaerobaculia bacterium]
MTKAQHVRAAIVAAAAFVSVAANAQTACGPTPERYRSLPFGDARFAVEESCRYAFTQNEQFFLAGIAQRLRTSCKLPRDVEGRALVERFTGAAALSIGLQKRQARLQESLPSPPDRASVFAAGTSLMDDIPCNGPEAALLARGIVIYLKRTSGSSRFVAGCVEAYSGQHGEPQCRCIADAVRAVLPDVDQRFFDRAIVKESIHGSPRVALQLMFSCGVNTY